MKKCALITALLIYSTLLIAQISPYRFIGKISDPKGFKFAVLTLPDVAFKECKIIREAQFEFTGEFFEHMPRFGNLTIWNVILTNDTARIEDTNPQIKIVLEPEVVINYDSKLDQFDVIGGPLNQVNNQFRREELRYRSRTDSLTRLMEQNSADQKKVKDMKQKFPSLYLDMINSKSEVIKKYPNSDVSLNEFSNFAVFAYYSRDKTKELFMRFPESLRKTKYGRRLDSMYNDMFDKLRKPDMLGKQFPKFELVNERDIKIKGPSEVAKYTLIDFWASWCMPCRAEYPFIKSAYEKYKTKGFQVITISIDKFSDKDKWHAAILKDGIGKLVNLYCPSSDSGVNDIAKHLNINAIPANYLINAKGIILATDLRGKSLEEKLKSLMPN